MQYQIKIVFSDITLSIYVLARNIYLFLDPNF